MTIVLGIDPGSRITGYGIVAQHSREIEYIDSGCIRTGDGSLSERLLIIFNSVCELLETYHPHQLSIEDVFMHQNAQSALKLGHARGVAMVAAASHRLPVHEYSPRQIKQTVVGNGGAEKGQVNHMVKEMLKLDAPPQVDAGDALAAAICHCHHSSGMQALTKMSRGRRRVRR